MISPSYLDWQMGSLRFLLALSVVLSHLGGIFNYRIAGGVAAVELFYIISGFFMALILTEKYDPRVQKYLFYSNRVLRIYSTYYVVMAFSFIISIISYYKNRQGILETIIDNGNTLGAFSFILVALSQLAIIGQDIFQFSSVGEGGLQLFDLQHIPDEKAWGMMLIPPAWSVSLELMFYLIVPFLIRMKNLTLFSIIIGSIIARVLFYMNGMRAEPWNYRFFPFELTWFVLGMLSYRFYQYSLPHFGGRRVYLISALTVISVLCVQAGRTIARRLGLPEEVFLFPYYFAFSAALPCLFHATRANPIDAKLADFSYPLYLVHTPVIVLFGLVLGVPDHGNSSPMRTICATAGAVMSAWLVVEMVERPMDRYRQRRLRNQLAGSCQSAPVSAT